MIIPVSTYRLQLNAGFNFTDVAEVIPYLNELGITTIYASPFFAAPAGSMHGYDVCDPHTLNGEIGTIDQLQRIAGELRERKMSWLQDVVPNHMVFAMTNRRLADVLERGVYSPYYNWFDIDWQHPHRQLHGKLMVPFLGKQLKDCLHDQEIKIDFGEAGFTINYLQQVFPLSISAYELLLHTAREEKASPAVEQQLQQLYAEAIMGWPLNTWREIKTSLVRSFLDKEENRTAMLALLEKVNAGQEQVQRVLEQQYYQLSWWQNANQVINYRRFFAVNELIAVNMAEEEVFYDYHNFINKLYEQKLIQGLRIDHIDGLEDPTRYLHRLRQLVGNTCYIIVEKILEQEEKIPEQWPIQGTTGYEFMAQVNWLFTNTTGAHEMKVYYRSLFPEMEDYKTITFEKKHRFLQVYMGGEWDNLVTKLYTLQLVPETTDREALKQALGLVMCCMPVYRLYPGDEPLNETAKQLIDETFKEAVQKAPALREHLSLLLSLWQTDEKDKEINKPRLAFQQRLMQFTGPVMAKGVEDTTFYVYNALLDHNEVGDSPDKDHYSVNDFHAWILQRQQQFPFSLNATSTHDTKRGEDGRLRVNVLTWFAQEWQQQVELWRQLNASRKTTIDNKQLPALQDEYFIYQSLIAGFPEDGEVTAAYIERLKAYFIKSAREAKLYTNWQTPDTAYEEAGCRFIENILSPDHDFVKSFLPFFKPILRHAQLLSLTQVLIKCTVPGVPDIYQGSEMWNTSYVDPDNRLPVDFSIRRKYLREIREAEKQGFPAQYSVIACARERGLEKLFVIWKTLQCRKEMEVLFLRGSYMPLYASTDCGIIAFAREYESDWVLVIAPVSGMLLTSRSQKNWDDVYLPLPAGAPVSWKNVFTGETTVIENNLPLKAALTLFPVALLTGKNQNKQV